jgi:hypothetical protein
MNIFVLDHDIPTCATYHVDRHVVKMILESAQMLCTAINKAGGAAPYRSTHINHPCTKWVSESLSNWLWLKDLGLALNNEYQFRYETNKVHRSAEVIRALQAPNLPDLGLTPFAQAMPEEYKVPGNAIDAYRRFYIGEKSGFATWTRRKVPGWFTGPETSDSFNR